jgi:hypothetical protein
VSFYTALVLAGAAFVVAFPAIHVLLVVSRVSRWRAILKEAPAILVSPDGNLWSDGLAWHEISVATPSNAYRSPDGTKWWDGKRWHDVVS